MDNNFSNGLDQLNNTSSNPNPQVANNNLNQTPVQTSVGNIAPMSNESANVPNPSVPNTTNVVSPTVESTPLQPELIQVNNEPITPVEPTPMPSAQPQPYVNNNPMSEPNGPVPEPNTNPVNSASIVEDETLLKAYIGNNYEKITTRPFNFAGFFFTTFYLFYRKMFVYGLLLFLVNLIVINLVNNIFVSLIFCVIVSLVVNKLYLSFAKKNIAKIKLQNQEADQTRLVELCTAKGRTSVGNIFLGLLAETGIAFVVGQVMILVGLGNMFPNILSFNVNGNINDNNTQEETSNNGSNTQEEAPSNKQEGTLLEDVKLSGYSCFASNCTIMVSNGDETVNYSYKADNVDLFTALSDYKDEVKVNIYYTQSNDEKTIVGYQLFLRSTNEDITNIKTESELRDKLGLYAEGTHTETMTLVEIGMTGAGFKDDETYTYTNYTFKDSRNNEFEMEYVNAPNDTLVEGNQYTVTFEVVEGTFNYDYNIISIN